MKRPLATAAVVIAAMMFLPPGSAQTQTPPAATAASPDIQTFENKSADVRAQMQKMQDQMARMAQTTDPAERQKIMQEHWATMQSAMTGMRGMWGPGMGPGPMMRGPGMGWGGMHGYYSNLSPEQLQQRRYMMDQYMGMQQTMLDHMLQHQQWMSQLPQAPSGSK